MTIRSVFPSTLVLLAGLLTSAAFAHHSTSGLYNQDELVELTGTVKQWRLVNPHPSLLLEVVDSDGEVHEWAVSYGNSAAGHLTRRGYTAETFKPGDVIVVSGFVANLDSAYALLIRGDPTAADGSPLPAP